MNKLNTKLITEKFDGATILITGGTGSFGSTMAKYLLNSIHNINEVRIFSRDESKQDLMRNTLGNSKMKFYLGDVREYQSIYNACKGVNYIFHAAALKQVPSTEFFPTQAVSTNILGSVNTIEAAINCGVNSMVCLSTDKAVYPINAMGMTKALMEKIAQSYSRLDKTTNKLTISITRYGNVMMSRGSIIPLLVSQALKKEKLSITDPQMTRFLMSLDDSVDLVLNAFVNADPGDLFIRKAPASTIGDLATAIAEIFDLKPEHREIIGIRHGEKIYETLVSSEEMAHSNETQDYFQIKLDSRNLDYANYFSSEKKLIVKKDKSFTSDNAERLNVKDLKKLLLSLDDFKELLKHDR